MGLRPHGPGGGGGSREPGPLCVALSPGRWPEAAGFQAKDYEFRGGARGTGYFWGCASRVLGPGGGALARLGQPAASGFAGAELESQAELRFFRARAWSCSFLHPLTVRQTDRARGSAVLPPSTSATSPLAAVSGVRCSHQDRKLVLKKGGGAEHDV